MQTNFVPVAFQGEADSCPVCVARVKLEELLTEERQHLLSVSTALSTTGATSAQESAAQASVWSAFAQMLGDYRVAFAVNLSIWFSAERFGRAKKVPDLLMAYDEYRLQSLASFEQFDSALKSLLQLLSRPNIDQALADEVKKLEETHKTLMESVSAFWSAVDAWTIPRKADAFNVL